MNTGPEKHIVKTQFNHFGARAPPSPLLLPLLQCNLCNIKLINSTFFNLNVIFQPQEMSTQTMQQQDGIELQSCWLEILSMGPLQMCGLLAACLQSCYVGSHCGLVDQMLINCISLRKLQVQYLTCDLQRIKHELFHFQQ